MRICVNMKFLVILIFCLVACNAAPAINGGIVEIETNKLDEENLEESQKQVETATIVSLERIKEINVECMDETRLDKEVIANVVTNMTVPKDDENYQHFLACSYRKQKYLNDKGEIQYQNIKRFLSQYYKVEDLKVLDICGQLKQSSNPGRNAINALECILPKLVEIEEIRDE